MKNCKLLEICTAQMCLIITGCSGTIVVNLDICYKKIEKQMEAISFLYNNP